MIWPGRSPQLRQLRCQVGRGRAQRSAQAPGSTTRGQQEAAKAPLYPSAVTSLLMGGFLKIGPGLKEQSCLKLYVWGLTAVYTWEAGPGETVQRADAHALFACRRPFVIPCTA